MPKPKPDFRIEGHSTIYLVHPLNDPAEAYLHEHTADDATWFAGALVVEHRFIADLVTDLRAHGFLVE